MNNGPPPCNKLFRYSNHGVLYCAAMQITPPRSYKSYARHESHTTNRSLQYCITEVQYRYRVPGCNISGGRWDIAFPYLLHIGGMLHVTCLEVWSREARSFLTHHSRRARRTLVQYSASSWSGKFEENRHHQCSQAHTMVYELWTLAFFQVEVQSYCAIDTGLHRAKNKV